MKSIAIVIVLFLTAHQLHAQSDSSRSKPVRALTLHVSNGVNILQNEQLRSIYRTKTLYFWGVGVRVAPVTTGNSLFVAIDYNSSSFSTDVGNKPASSITPIDSTLHLQQLIFSLSIKMLEGKDVVLRARAGVMSSFLTNTVQRQESSQVGLKIGLGLERKLSRHQSFEIFVDYDLTKLNAEGLRGYDVVKMGFGFYL